MEVAVTSFVLGLLSSASPCVLPLYPGFLAYLSGAGAATTGRTGRALGAFVLLGVLTMMLALGAVIAALAVPIGRTLAVILPAVDGVILALGLAMLLNRNPFRRLRQVRVPLLRRPYANAYAYGLLYGPIAFPCSGPLLVAVFAVSLTVAEAFDKLWVFAWFGLGFGLPLLVISVLSSAAQSRLTRLFAVHDRLLNRLGGILLVAVALFDLRQNWDLLRLAALFG